MTDPNDEKIPGGSDPTPYKLWRINSAGEQIALVGEYATLEEMRTAPRRLDWHYGEYNGRKG